MTLLPAPVAAEVDCLLDARYSDLDLGLADCSIMVLAERYETQRLQKGRASKKRPARTLH